MNINVNTASESELIRIPGIGKVKARNKLSYHKKHGVFSEEALFMSGVG